MSEQVLSKEFFSRAREDQSIINSQELAKPQLYEGRTGLPPQESYRLHQFREMMMYYSCAIKEVCAKVEVLNEEFQVKGHRNPISSIKSRVKEPLSIFEKLHRKGFPTSLLSIWENLHDVAGVRIICPFIEDIYAVARMLTAQDDVRVLLRKDYIQNPKSNGYRSLHLVVEVPVFLSDRKIPVKVEIQIRTIAMDFWASLEHQIHYKKVSEVEGPIVEELKACADVIYHTDLKMQEIQKKLETTEKNRDLSATESEIVGAKEKWETVK